MLCVTPRTTVYWSLLYNLKNSLVSFATLLKSIKKYQVSWPCDLNVVNAVGCWSVCARRRPRSRRSPWTRCRAATCARCRRQATCSRGEQRQLKTSRSERRRTPMKETRFLPPTLLLQHLSAHQLTHESIETPTPPHWAPVTASRPHRSAGLQCCCCGKMTTTTIDKDATNQKKWISQFK